MTTELHLHDTSADCARFEAQVGDWLEQELAAADQAFMLRHRSACRGCDALVRDLEELIASAAALPTVAPSRDLWQELEPRLGTPVIPMISASNAVPGVVAPDTERSGSKQARSISLRRFAMAAALLVSVTSAVTWQFAKSPAATPAGTAGVASTMESASTPTTTDSVTATDGDLPAATASLAVGTPGSGTTAPTATAPSAAAARFASRASDDAEVPDANATYEREITALRRIVDERFAELDAGTVRELRRNLDIIDRAIADSKAALDSDPRSALGSSQLDRALQAKLDLMRRVALL